MVAGEDDDEHLGRVEVLERVRLVVNAEEPKVGRGGADVKGFQAVGIGQGLLRDEGKAEGGGGGEGEGATVHVGLPGRGLGLKLGDDADS